MIIFQNQNVIRMTISENQVWYWTGRQFVLNPANARKYHNPKHAARMVAFLVRSALAKGAIWNQESHLMESGTYGFLEVCVAIITDKANKYYHPRENHQAAYLKGEKSYSGAA